MVLVAAAAVAASTIAVRPPLRNATSTPCVRTGSTCRCEWWVRDHVVNYLNPSQTLDGQGKPVPRELAQAAQLVNGQYPGPLLECWENDDVEVVVYNDLIEQGVSIHWHGLWMSGYNGSGEGGTPWADGVHRVTQGPINPGQRYTYRFKAWPPGTHWWHSHMDTYQADKGIKGPIVIHKRDDPFLHMYDEEILIGLSDTRRVPEICLKLEGQPLDIGNPVCNEVDRTTWNGAWGNGSSSFPYPIIEVEQGKCYRLRWFAMTGNTQNYRINVYGHNQTIVALDSFEIKPHTVGGFNLHNGERVDAVLCADQKPGSYLINATYDLACELVHDPLFSPLPPVDSCNFYAFIHYKGSPGVPKNVNASVPGGMPQGTGGGRNATAQGLVNGQTYDSPYFLDLNTAEGYAAVEPLRPDPVPHPVEPDYRYWLYGGITGADRNESTGFMGGQKDPTDVPLEGIGRTYLSTREGPPDSWSMSPHWPESPLLQTKAQCGANGAPILNVPEDAKEIELVLTNLSPSAHVFHLHGMPFDVINYGWPEWCNYQNHDFCFFMGPKYPCPGPGHLYTGPGASPHPDPKGHLFGGNCAPEICKGEVVISDPINPKMGGGYYWGCKYNASEPTHTKGLNLKTPIRKDMISLWRHQWAVIRIRPTNPGMWLLHCHMEQHVSTGMMIVLNVLPSKQPPIPDDVPTNGPCPVWSKKTQPAPPRAPTAGQSIFVDQYVVDYRRPSALPKHRRLPDYIYPAYRQSAVLANGTFPGPTLETAEGVPLSVDVVVYSMGDGTAVHFHGIDATATPWFDGTNGVSQEPISADNRLVYTVAGSPAGTHYWHSQLDGIQAARGLKGPLIVRAKDDPHQRLYDEEIVMSLSDVQKEPEVCLAGSVADGEHFQRHDGANFAPCPMLDKIAFDGQFGDDSTVKYQMRPLPDGLFTRTEKYPYKLYSVTKGKCYRFRIIAMLGEARRVRVSVAGHSMKVIATDGTDVEPVDVRSLTLYNGERYDVVLCADQKEGTYIVTASYDDACDVAVAGLRGQPVAKQCSFYAGLQYFGGIFNSSAPAPTGNPPKGTRGGASPRSVAGPDLDLGKGGYGLLRQLRNTTIPDAAADVRLRLGVTGTGLAPPRSRMYLHTSAVSWTVPAAPLLQAKGKCSGRTPVVKVPVSADAITLTIENLTPEPHSVHLHSLPFVVVGATAPCAGISAADCVALRKCPAGTQLTAADAEHPQMGGGAWFGCVPASAVRFGIELRKDTVPVPPRGTVTLRVRTTGAGMWPIHAMSASDQLLGAQTVLDVRSASAPPSPSTVPSAACPA